MVYFAFRNFTARRFCIFTDYWDSFSHRRGTVALLSSTVSVYFLEGVLLAWLYRVLCKQQGGEDLVLQTPLYRPRGSILTSIYLTTKTTHSFPGVPGNEA
jgi:hypothetical protein